MHDECDTALPVHPVTGLTALGLRRNGAPIWPVLGGSGEDDPAPDGEESEEDADPAGGADPQDDGDGDGDEDPDGADKLGDAGKKALDAMKAKLKAERAKTRQAKAELEKLRNGAGGGDTDAEKVKREAEQTATAKANQRILRAEVKAAAAGKLADPSDAYKFLDLTAFEVDDNGEVDADEIAEAIDELVARKPYLAATTTRPPTKRFAGTGDGGPRGTGKRSLDQQIQDAENAKDWKTARRLKLQKSLQPQSK